MDRLHSYSVGELLYNVWLNTLQDHVAVLRPASNGDLSSMPKGMEWRVWQATADLTTGTQVEVDGNTVNSVNTGTSPATITAAGLTVSWKDRLVAGLYRGFGGADRRPGQANDYQFDLDGAPTLFYGYLGKGAYDAGGVNPPSNGNPPVRASASSYAAELAANLWLYAHPSSGKLYLYNDTGSTIRTPNLFFFGSAATGKRP